MRISDWSSDVCSSDLLGVSDGSGNRASFAQPVGLATVQQMLYACDAAGSAIRSVNARSGQVTTLLGQDTWNFGKADGARVAARLQQQRAYELDPDTPGPWLAYSCNEHLPQLRLRLEERPEGKDSGRAWDLQW